MGKWLIGVAAVAFALSGCSGAAADGPQGREEVALANGFDSAESREEWKLNQDAEAAREGRRGELAVQVEAAFIEAHGSPAEVMEWSMIDNFTDGDAPLVAVSTRLTSENENHARAEMICEATAGLAVTAELRGALVTAADDAILAECGAP